MGKSRSTRGAVFARQVLIPYWFEIVSGIVVGFGMILILARTVPVS